MRLFFIALSFFTQIPIQMKNVTEHEFYLSMMLQPIVGLFIGAILWIASYLFSMINVPSLSAFLLLLLYLALTGGLHLDGVSDTCDALFSARDRSKMFEIMKDSRLGSFGAISLIIILLGYFISYEWFITTSHTSVLLLSPVIGRFCAVTLICYSKAADGGGGLGKGAVAASKPWIPLLYGVLLFTLSWFFYDRVILLSELLALLYTLWLMYIFRKMLGGITGDCIGITIETAPLVFLLITIVFFQLQHALFF